MWLCLFRFSSIWAIIESLYLKINWHDVVSSWLGYEVKVSIIIFNIFHYISIGNYEKGSTGCSISVHQPQTTHRATEVTLACGALPVTKFEGADICRVRKKLFVKMI